MSYDIHTISSPVCDAWIAGVRDEDVEYCYGGTRLVRWSAPDADAEEDLVRLMFEESHLKNLMINRTLESDLLRDLQSELPKGYLKSRVGGGRCIMRPKSEALYEILRNPAHPEFEPLISQVFREIGEFLNTKGGRFKLTPDFGRYAGLADHLANFTPHVLGVRCPIGGCGGKASYTVSGIVNAMRALGLLRDKRARYTLVGASGALGSGVLEFFTAGGYRNLAVCDLAYDDGTEAPPAGLPRLAAREGRFTDECLERGGILIFTTWGEELENSDIDRIPPGSILVLAHNLSVPPGERGKQLMRDIADREVFAIPGQVLTLGGALTSRLEWFWRQSYPNTDFTAKKPLAHEIARRVGAFLVTRIDEVARQQNLTPYEAMWAFAQDAI